MSIFAKIKCWYLGGPLPTKERISDTAEIIREPNTFEPSVSARVAQFLVKHLPGILAALFAAAVALFIHFDAKSAEHNGAHPSDSGKAKSVNRVSARNFSIESEQLSSGIHDMRRQ